MEIFLNGKKINSECRTIMELVMDTGFDTQSLIVEHNFELVRQEAWKEALIKESDTIELLSFVGGG